MFADVVSSGLTSWWAPALAFAAGVVSFASPCVCPLVPGYLALVTGGQEREDRSTFPVLMFIFGFALVFTLLGAFTWVMLPLLRSETGTRVSGGIVVLFGLVMILYALRVRWPALYAERRPFLARVNPGAAGAFPLGMAFAAGWTPCIGRCWGASSPLRPLRVARSGERCCCSSTSVCSPRYSERSPGSLHPSSIGRTNTMHTAGRAAAPRSAMGAAAASPRSRRRWRAVLVAAPFVMTVLLSIPAHAHAFLVSSDPSAGDRLATAPGAVTLTFSESVEQSVSTATVTTPDGQRVTGTASGNRIDVLLTTNAPGVYRVAWKAVSVDDGHTTEGTFQFSVATARGPSAATSGGGVSSQGLGFAVGRTIQYAALLYAAGLLVLAMRARRDPALEWLPARLRVRLRLALLAAFLSTVGVVTAEAAVAQGSLSIDSVARFLEGPPGGARLSLLALEAVAMASAGATMGPLTIALVGGALIALAASGHAAAVRPAWAGISVDAAHLLAAGVWAGGILALGTIRPPGGWREPAGRLLLSRFTPVAVGSFLVSVVFGGVQAIQELGRLGALWGTSYGRVLLAKIAAVAAMVPLSLFAWRRRLFRRSEAGLAVVVVAVAALLSVVPVPKPQVEAAAAPSTAGLPQPGDLTLGGDAGRFLLGLTLRPGEPGRNLAIVYLKPVEGAAKGVPVQLAVGGRTFQTAACGSTCRSAVLDVRGGEQVAVQVGGAGGGRASFTVPPLPAPSGAALLGQVQRRMHALRTFRLAESLSSGLGTTVRSDYSFEAPDRMTIDTHSNGGSSQSVWIGGTRYLRQSPSPRWQVQPGGPPAQVPSFIWDYFRPLEGAHLVGRATVDGVPVRILAFFGTTDSTPLWFRLWVDHTGLVRRAEMRAFGHFMDHRYYAFDSNISIQPPVT